MTARKIATVIIQLESIKRDLRRDNPDDDEYREWADGIIAAAVAALKLLGGK